MILIVDDQADIRKILSLALTRAGFLTDVAQNGAEAIEKAKKFNPQLILLDVMMPQMDGFEACRRIREIENLRNVPVIFLTALDEESQVLTGYELGAVDYLTKPVSHAFLIAKIKAILARQQREAANQITDIRPDMIVADRYKVLTELGRGGMGVVFEVEHISLGMRMALKAQRNVGDDPVKARERFQRETEALASLQHPNLIRVHDSGAIGKILYYTMDLLPGGCVYDRITEEALETCAKIAEAMQVAHDKGILHRDLKTDNVMYSQTGEPIVTDFSLVINTRKENSRLTTRGIVLGTPHYMSPEQVRDPRDIDKRSDIYCLGTMLFEMLTSQTPYHESSEMEAMVKIMLEDVPSPQELVADLTDSAAKVCLKALQRDRRERYQSAGELALAARQAMLDT